MPIAVFTTIIAVTIIYSLAGLALVGMLSYHDIDTESGFILGFKARGYVWAEEITAIGELVTLPLVVFVSFLAQPRLQYAMAVDGLLPKVFMEVNRSGNLLKGILISGAVCTPVAMFVPFTYLEDMISAGVLLSFSLTNAALILIRRQNTAEELKCKKLLLVYTIYSVIVAAIFTNVDMLAGPSNMASAVLLIITLVGVMVVIHRYCPESVENSEALYYKAPFVPFLPLFGIFINILLLLQLSEFGLIFVLVYFLVATTVYFCYSIHHSIENSPLVSLHRRSRTGIVMNPVQGNRSGNDEYSKILPTESSESYSGYNARKGISGRLRATNNEYQNLNLAMINGDDAHDYQFEDQYGFSEAMDENLFFSSNSMEKESVQLSYPTINLSDSIEVDNSDDVVCESLSNVNKSDV